MAVVKTTSKVYGKLVIARFLKRKLSYYNRQKLRQLMYSNLCIMQGETDGSKIIFFCQNGVEAKEIFQFLDNNFAEITEKQVQQNDQTRSVLVNQATEMIESRLKELLTARLEAIGFGTRVTKFRNITKEYLQLRQYAEFYSQLLSFRTDNYQSQTIEGVKELRKYYDLIVAG